MTRGLSAVLVCMWVSAGVAAAQSAASSGVPRVMRFDGQASVSLAGPRAAVIAVFDAPTGGAPVWEEAQVLQFDAEGRFSVLVGAGQANGLPPAALASSGPRWLEVRVDGEMVGARVLLTSVPYALRAADADTLGGLPASAFLRTPSARRGSSSSGTGTAAPANADSPLVNSGATGYIGKFANSIDLTSSALFENGGRVGLGTTTPSDYVHVRFADGSGTATGYAVQNLSASAGAYSGMLFYDQNGTLAQFQGFNNFTHEYRINNIASGGSINFMLGSAPRFVITSTGIGVGITVPSDALDVAGSVRSNVAFRFVANGVTSGVSQEASNSLINIGINDGRSGPYSTVVRGGFFRVDSRYFEKLFTWWKRDSGGEQLIMSLTPAGVLNVPGVRSTTLISSPLSVMVDGSGDLGIVSSSRRFKKDIRDMAEASAGLMALRPVTYHYRNTPEAAPLEYGLIAEEVAEIYPDLVARLGDGTIETVQYHKVNAMLLNEVQKQHRQIEVLTERLAALEKLLTSAPK